MPERTIRKILALAVLTACLGVGTLEAGDIQTDGAFVSTTTSGPPLVVSSSDKVTNLNADMVDGLHGTDLATKMGNVVTVAATGGDFTSISGANASITDASATNPYLVEIAPGIYSESSFFAKPYVHYRGSGEGVTTLRGTGTAPMMEALDNSTLSDLTIENGTAAGVTFRASNAIGVRLHHVTASSPNGANTDFNTPIVVTAGSSVVFRDVTALAHATGGPKLRGIQIDNSTVELYDIEVDIETAGGGVRAIEIRDSAAVTIDGGTVVSGSDGTGGANIGLWVDGSIGSGVPTVIAERLWIDVSGSDADNRGATVTGGVLEIAQSSMIVDSGGSQGRGIRGGTDSDDLTEITARDCSITISGGGTEVGIEGFGTSSAETITVFDSRIEAGGGAVASAGSGWTINLIRSHLAGGAMGGSGTVVCRYMTDESFGASTTSCPS